MTSVNGNLTPIDLSIPIDSFKKEKLQGGPKKSLWWDLKEKCLENSKMFFDGVFLSIFTSSQEVRAF